MFTLVVVDYRMPEATIAEHLSGRMAQKPVIEDGEFIHVAYVYDFESERSRWERGARREGELWRVR